METVKLDRFVPGGQAIGTLNSGKKAFVWGGLPGEVVEFRVTKRKRSYIEGIVTKVIEASPHRTSHRDTCYLATSPWQVVNYDHELEQKTLLVKEAFRQEKISASIGSTVTDGGEYFYRNKMEYSLYWSNETESVELAFHERGSHRKVPITSSSLERPEVLDEAKLVVNGINERGEEARTYSSLVVRCNQQGIAQSLLFLKNQPHLQGIALTDTLLGRQFSYSPNGFFQINLPVYELALSEIKKHINTSTVVDMYAGVGTIGLTAAADRQLTLVETNKAAFTELVENCGLSLMGSAQPRRTLASNSAAASAAQHYLNAPSPILARSEDALEHITAQATIIVDPPRAGLDPKVVNRLLEVKPPTIIYLSCNPTTQARDIAPLLKSYKITLAQPYNFFPHTPHIENLVVLERCK
jgi:23S rRNA (uracil1939-C5)-methyltransferase